MQEYVIEVLHVPSGQYLLIYEQFDLEEIVDEEGLADSVATNLTVNVRKVD